MGQLAVSREGYIEIKQKIKDRLNETANSFIIIGYSLKQIRDSGAYRYDGYRNMEEFEQGEYGISKSTGSRFMRINTEFSRDGNSPEIKDEYRNYGYSKLQEMINMSPEDRGLITEAASVEQAKALRRMEVEERQAAEAERQKNLPLMRMAAPENAMRAAGHECIGPESPEPLDAVLAAFWQEDMELYAKAAAGMITPEIMAEEICPSGSRLYRNGTDMIFFYDFDRGMKLRSMKHGKPVITPYTYRELLEKTQAPGILHTGKEAVATPQDDALEEYKDYAEDSDENIVKPEETAAGQGKNVIDGECGEPDEKEPPGGECPYADIEIRNAADYFETECFRMSMTGRNTAKQRNYKIALECIRKCFGTIAEQAADTGKKGKSE